ncbi:MAG: sensor histidine kinase [Marinilabiliaceae bacterium]|jgi:sensor histidine kinase YesM|nr:sensor histidine kinase [Marinilabiliaceae bacterium]
MYTRHLNRIKQVLLHTIFWIVVWLFYKYFLGYNSASKVYVNWFSALLLPLTMISTYIMVYGLIPRYLLKKDYSLFALKSFYLLVFTCYMIAVILYACLIIILDFNINLMPPMSKNFLFVLILVLLVLGAVSSISILNHNLKTISSNKELQNKILATQLQLKEQELYYLKSQIHPHFLFNTLNTIYGMAIKNSEHTPDMILRLSNLLDYILYQVNKPVVSLKEEIEHIKEYIELEKVRFKDTLKVTFISDNIDDDIETAPMLLIPFIENAFKHGAIIDGYLRIEIRLKMKGDRLDFSIRNSVSETGNNSDGGLGLENLGKRLDAHFPASYILEHYVENSYFNIHLVINNIRTLKDA